MSDSYGGDSVVWTHEFAALEARVAKLEKQAADSSHAVAVPRPAEPEIKIGALSGVVEIRLRNERREFTIRIPRERFAELRRVLDEVEGRFGGPG